LRPAVDHDKAKQIIISRLMYCSQNNANGGLRAKNRFAFPPRCFGVLLMWKDNCSLLQLPQSL